MKSAPRDLYPGSPLCAPLPAVLSESLVSLIRTLHCNEEWEDYVNQCILEGVRAIRDVGINKEQEVDVSNVRVYKCMGIYWVVHYSLNRHDDWMKKR